MPYYPWAGREQEFANWIQHVYPSHGVEEALALVNEPGRSPVGQSVVHDLWNVFTRVKGQPWTPFTTDQAGNYLTGGEEKFLKDPFTGRPIQTPQNYNVGGNANTPPPNPPPNPPPILPSGYETPDWFKDYSLLDPTSFFNWLETDVANKFTGGDMGRANDYIRSWLKDNPSAVQQYLPRYMKESNIPYSGAETIATGIKRTDMLKWLKTAFPDANDSALESSLNDPKLQEQYRWVALSLDKNKYPSYISERYKNYDINQLLTELNKIKASGNPQAFKAAYGYEAPKVDLNAKAYLEARLAALGFSGGINPQESYTTMENDPTAGGQRRLGDWWYQIMTGDWLDPGKMYEYMGNYGLLNQFLNPTDYSKITGTQFQDPTKYFDPSLVNKYYNTAWGNLNQQAGTAAQRAGTNAAQVAASRGLLNPGAFTTAASSKAYQPFGAQFGQLELGRAGDLRKQKEDLYNAIFSGQQATEASRQFNIDSLFQRNQADFANAGGLLGMGHLYNSANENADAWAKIIAALGGLANIGKTVGAWGVSGGGS